jgi:NDP-sugar pyrophosphorylase family protein
MLPNMKAMILAAGIGSRLGALTQSTPKCLMPLGNGETILDHVAKKLITLGASELVINTHHMAKQIEAHISQQEQYGITVHLSHETSLLDTGGGLKNVARHFENESAFIVHNADIYCTADIGMAYQTHLKHQASATLVCMTRSSKRGVFVDTSNKVTGWTGEQPPHTPKASERQLAFGGISICSPSIFQYMPDQASFSIMEPFLLAARNTNNVYASEIDATTWADIGTPEKLLALQKQLRDSE